MSSDHYGYIKERYKAYLDQRRRINENSLSVAAKYDQWTLTISGGALALSITFIEKVATAPYQWSIPLIALAWLCFALSLLSGLLAIRYSSQALVKQVEILDEEYSRFSQTSTESNWAGEQVPEVERIFPKKIKKWSRLSLTNLVLGIIFLCAFSIININTKAKGSKMNEEQKQEPLEEIQKSYVPPKNDIPLPSPPRERTETYIPSKNEIPPPTPPKKEK